MPPANVIDKRTQEQARDVLRTEELNRVSDKARRDLANAESDFKATLARQRLQWAQGEEEHTKRTQEMSLEIESLEKRKEQALIPIEMYKQEANELYTKAEETLALVKEKEVHVDGLANTLEDRLDLVGEREQNLATEENKVRVRLAGIIQQEQTIEHRSKSLTERITSFMAEKSQAEKEIFDQKEELILKERSLLAKEESLKRTEESLRVFDIKLKDERATLDRAFKRIESQLSPSQETEKKI